MYSEPYQKSKMELLAKIGNGCKSLTMIAKWSILDIWQGSEYDSEMSSILGTYSMFLVCLFIFGPVSARPYKIGVVGNNWLIGWLISW